MSWARQKYSAIRTFEDLHPQTHTEKTYFSGGREEEPFTTPITSSLTTSSWTKFFKALTVLMVLYTLFSTAVIIRWFPSHSTSQLQSVLTHHCGNTTKEAKALGCQFDFLSYSWVPSECFDEATATEFEDWVREENRLFGSWPLFSDRNGTSRIPDKETLAERVGVKTYTTQEEHLGHCIYMMRRFRRALDGDFELRAQETMAHVVHCSNEVMKGLKGPNPLDEGRLNAIFSVGIASCRVSRRGKTI